MMMVQLLVQIAEIAKLLETRDHIGEGLEEPRVLLAELQLLLTLPEWQRKSSQVRPRS